MSLIQVREAFTEAAGKTLQLAGLIVNYSEDRRAQMITAWGTLVDGTRFNASTGAFTGNLDEVVARAARLAAEIAAPEGREQGTSISLTDEKGAAKPVPAAKPKRK